MFLTHKPIKNLPITTPTRINARNIAKAAILIRQMCNKYGVIKPITWLICHGSNSQQFKSWWQTHMLIIGQPDKMFWNVRNSKWSRGLFATLLETLTSDDNHNVSNFVFSVCMSECLAKLQDTAMSLLHCSPSQNFLQRQSSLLGLSYHFVMQTSGSQYLQRTCSPSPMAL